MSKIATRSFLISVTAMMLLSGCAGIYHQMGDNEYAEKNYLKAIEYYEKSQKSKLSFANKKALASTYFITQQCQKAVLLYKSILDSIPADTTTLLLYGKSLMCNSNYETAKIVFKKYASLKPNDKQIIRLIASCDSAPIFMTDTNLFSIKREAIGDFQLQLGVTPYKNGIVFAANKAQLKRKKTNFGSEDSYLDLYFMDKDSSGKWGTPELLQGDINGPYHEGPAAFSNDSTMYFTRSNYTKRRLKKNHLNVNTLKIFKASLINKKWKKQEEFPFSSNDYSCGHPSISADGKTMYFISDMPGGFGQTDIYVSKFENNAWQKPVNLGSTINTEGKELFPCIISDTLYFSSDTHVGLGGLDIFMSHFDGQSWSPVKNLRAPVNSPNDNFAFILSKLGKAGFVSSNTSDGHDNTFAVTKKEIKPLPANLPYDTLVVKLLQYIKARDTLYIPLIKGELLNVSTKVEKDTLLGAENRMIANRIDFTEKGFAVALSNLIKSKMDNEQKVVLTRVGEILKRRKMVVDTSTGDTLTTMFYTLIHNNDTMDIPLIKKELLKNSTIMQKKMILESEKRMISNRNDITEKNYATTLSQYVKDKKEKQNIDILGRVEQRKKNKNVILLTKNNKRPKAKNAEQDPTFNYVSVNANKPKSTIKFGTKLATKMGQSRASYTNEIKLENAKLAATIAEIEQLFVADGSDPRSLLKEAKNKNEIMIHMLITKEKADREKLVQALSKIVADNLALKYSQGNPLTDLLDIVDAYDKKKLQLKYDTLK